MTYSDALAYLNGLQRFGIRLRLENILRLVEAFGHPEAAFRSIHVAGTNGKGSTAAFTNGILRAEVSVITNIGVEHQEHLGDTLESIAAEKAGIVREGGSVVSAAEGAALETVARIVREKGARLIRVQDEYRVRYLGRSDRGETFRLTGRLREYDSLQIPLLGRHQIVNATTAVAAAELLEEQGFTVGGFPIRQGLASAHWPGRLQPLSAT